MNKYLLRIYINQFYLFLLLIMSKNIEQINSEIKFINDQIIELSKNLDLLKKQKNKLLFESIDTFYTIRCVPDHKNRSIHTVGLYSSRKNARKFIPESKYSVDVDCNVTWNYSVVEIKIDEDSHLLSGLDERPPYYFPYTGW